MRNKTHGPAKACAQTRAPDAASVAGARAAASGTRRRAARPASASTALREPVRLSGLRSKNTSRGQVGAVWRRRRQVSKWSFTVSGITRKPRRRSLPRRGSELVLCLTGSKCPGRHRGTRGAAVAASKPIFPAFLAVGYFETSPRVEIAGLASCARSRQSGICLRSQGKKNQLHPRPGGRDDKTGENDMLQNAYFSTRFIRRVPNN